MSYSETNPIPPAPATTPPDDEYPGLQQPEGQSAGANEPRPDTGEETPDEDEDGSEDESEG